MREEDFSRLVHELASQMENLQEQRIFIMVRDKNTELDNNERGGRYQLRLKVKPLKVSNPSRGSSARTPVVRRSGIKRKKIRLTFLCVGIQSVRGKESGTTSGTVQYLMSQQKLRC